MTKIFRNHGITGWLVLTAFIAAWFLNIMTIPMITLIMGSSHHLSIENEHGDTHLVFTHHEYDAEDEDHDHFIADDGQEHHEPVSPSENSFSVLSQEFPDHNDHIIHVNGPENELIRVNNPGFLITERGPPVPDEINIIYNYVPPEIITHYKDFHYPSGVNTASLSLKTVILTI